MFSCARPPFSFQDVGGRARAFNWILHWIFKERRCSKLFLKIFIFGGDRLKRVEAKNKETLIWQVRFIVSSLYKIFARANNRPGKVKVKFFHLNSWSDVKTSFDCWWTKFREKMSDFTLHHEIEHIISEVRGGRIWIWGWLGWSVTFQFQTRSSWKAALTFRWLHIGHDVFDKLFLSIVSI